MKSVTSWGRLSTEPHRVVVLNDPSRVKSSVCRGPHPDLAYGMGRSYGDACLNPKGTLWVTTGLDHFIAFDDRTGYLVCEAGVLLRDIQRLVIPRGWMLPVTPGTQLVTVGAPLPTTCTARTITCVGLLAITSCALPSFVPMGRLSSVARMSGQIGLRRPWADWG